MHNAESENEAGTAKEGMCIFPTAPPNQEKNPNTTHYAATAWCPFDAELVDAVVIMARRCTPRTTAVIHMMRRVDMCAAMSLVQAWVSDEV
jgi:hypothetical protein